MGSLSVWHWLIVLLFCVGFVLPIYFLIKQPVGPNRYGDVASPMEIGAAIRAYFSNYFNFSGRASRSEFWWAMLFVTLISLIPIVNIIWSLATIIPSLSLTVRRLHDINRSGWHVLLGLLPPIGVIALLIWECTGPSDARAFVGNGNGDLDRIEKLMALKTSGAITEQEFEAQKRLVLGN